VRKRREKGVKKEGRIGKRRESKGEIGEKKKRKGG
jgi:hypothetical protein